MSMGGTNSYRDLPGGPGSGKAPGDTPVEPALVLRPGGTITIDDYTPTTTWPPLFGDQPDLAVIVGRHP